MKFNLPEPIANKMAHTLLVAEKHSPRILFATGIVLMGATVVSASRATIRLDGVLSDLEQTRLDIRDANLRDPDEFNDKYCSKLNAHATGKALVTITRLYVPSLALGVAAVSCLTKSHNILTRRNAGLSAALAATERALNGYRDRVRDEYGDEKDRALMFGTEEREVEVVKRDGTVRNKKIKVAGSGRSPYARVWGRDTSNEWDPQAEYNLAKLRSVQSWATMVLNSRGHLFLNEVHDELGLDRTPAGSQVGWLSQKYGGTDGYVDFGVLANGDSKEFLDFVRGYEDHILLDFNVDGEIWRSI